MNCSNCGTELLPGKQFCHACGAAAKTGCPRCSAEVDPSFRFCPDCGFDMGVSAPAAEGAEDKLSRLTVSMPTPLAEKIRATQGAIEGERKQVTVLFCDLAGSTAVAGKLDPEEYRELLERYLALAIHEVYRFEGIVNQLAGDGLMALFGAPVAHEDAPERAARAAIAIRDALAHFNDELQAERDLALPARIGVHTGPVVVGTVGNDMKMDYTAIGDTTNLASRLESLAPLGTVLVSEATARLVRGIFEMRRLPPLDVKGKAEPIIAYELLEVSAVSSPMAVAAARGLTPLVGRDEELAQLDACFRRSRGNLAQVVSVVSDHGMGKSRLLHEFKGRLANENVTILEGRCSALNRAEPYYPFTSMLRRYFDFSPNDSNDTLCEKVAGKVGMPADKIVSEYPVLCRFLSVPVADVADAAPAELRHQTFDAIADLVLYESRRNPVLIILEDLQWIDEPSRELLELAVSRLARSQVMVLVSHRPDYRPTWKTNAALTQLSLRPLGDDELGEILSALVGAALPAELQSQILAKAEGSPFFGEEITRALIEEGFVTIGDDGVVRPSRPIEEISIPGTVQEVLAARIDRLSPSAKRVTQVAAVLGRQFSRVHLERLVKAEGIDVDRELAELVGRGILHRMSLFSDEEFRFGESLTQEVAYEGLLLRQRRELHSRVGVLLEAESGQGGAARPALIAHHFSHSDDYENAVRATLSAAADAEKLPSYQTALDFYGEAWRLADAALSTNGDADASEAMRRQLIAATLGYVRVSVRYASSADPKALEAVQRGRPLAQELGDSDSLSGFYIYQGMLLSGDPERFGEGLKLVERGLEMVEHTGQAVTRISITRALAWNYLLDGRLDAARAKIDWAVDELEKLGHRDQLSDVYLGARWMRDSVLFFSGDFEAAFTSTRETYELSASASNRTIESAAAGQIAHGLFVRGDVDEALEWADRGLEKSEAIGSVAGVHRGAALALACRVELGARRGLDRYLRLIEAGLTTGGNLLLSIGVVVETLLVLEDVERAERFARLAHAHAAGRLRKVLSAIALADVYALLGPRCWGEAESLYRDATALASAIGVRPAVAWAKLGAGKLAIARGAPDSASVLLRQALALTDALEMGRYAAQAKLLLDDIGERDNRPRADTIEPAA